MAKILIVDDDAGFRSFVTKLAAAHGYDVIEAEDGLEGLSVLERERPDLVLLDISMPNLNGWELMETLKNRGDLGEVPIVILTGQANQDIRDRARQLGIVEILIKSCIVNDLIETLNRVLGTRGHQV